MDLISDLTVYDEINGKENTISLLLKGKYEFEHIYSILYETRNTK